MSDISEPKIVKLGLVQFAMQSDPGANLDRALAGIESVAKQGAQVVCLPELFRTRYFAVEESSSEAFLDELPGVLVESLSKLAKRLGIVVVGGSVYEQSQDHKFNTSVVIDADGSLLGCYRKVHIPHDPHFFEQCYFEPGDLGFKVFETRFAKIAVLICYDQWFPEAARAVALAGAEVIFYPTAIGVVDGIDQSEGSWQEAWENVQRGHAIANGLVVAAVNRCGREGSSVFWGGSFVCDAFGKTLQRASDREEDVVVDIDLNHGKRCREGWRFFYNRRPNQYGLITK